MARIADQLDAGKNVGVHCRQGIGRSGMIAAGVLVTSGSSPEDAMQAVSSARGAEVPETIEQSRWCNNYPRGYRSQRVDACGENHQNKL